MTLERPDIRVASEAIRRGCEDMRAVVDVLQAVPAANPRERRRIAEHALCWLVRHESNADDSHGPLATLLEGAGDLSGRIRLLQTEHRTLTTLARQMARELWDAPDPPQSDLARETEVLTRLADEHRSATLELLADVEARAPYQDLA